MGLFFPPRYAATLLCRSGPGVIAGLTVAFKRASREIRQEHEGTASRMALKSYATTISERTHLEN